MSQGRFAVAGGRCIPVGDGGSGQDRRTNMDIDLKKLKMTDEEKQELAWCYAYLEDSEAKEIEKEALDIAMREINGPEAADKLLELLVDVLLRNAAEQRCVDEQ
jgi:hypothetical protein